MIIFWFALAMWLSCMAGFLLACVLASTAERREIAKLTKELEGSEERLKTALRADAPGHKHHKGGA
jgi:hypothetical protein